MVSKFRSIKHYDGFSTCFRQWKAHDTHCRFLHGYSISIEVTFVGSLDHRNWVADFGILGRSRGMIDGIPAGKWLSHLFDHTVVIAQDDPAKESFLALAREGIIQVVMMDHVGCEKFAELILHKLNEFTKEETLGRVSVESVRVHENKKNSAMAVIE